MLLFEDIKQGKQPAEIISQIKLLKLSKNTSKKVTGLIENLPVVHDVDILNHSVSQFQSHEKKNNTSEDVITTTGSTGEDSSSIFHSNSMNKSTNTATDDDWSDTDITVRPPTPRKKQRQSMLVTSSSNTLYPVNGPPHPGLSSSHQEEIKCMIFSLSFFLFYLTFADSNGGVCMVHAVGYVNKYGYTYLCKLSELQMNKGTKLKYNKLVLGIFYISGEVYVIDNNCCHQNIPLNGLFYFSTCLS